MKLKPLSHMLLMSSMAVASCANASVDAFLQDSTLDMKAKVNIYNLSGTHDFNSKNAPISGTAKINMDEIGSSLWLDWQSGYLFDVIGVQLGYLGAAPNLRQKGYVRGSMSMGPITLPVSSDYGRYYEDDTKDKLVGKLGNANVQVRLGDQDNYGKLSVGRFTPTIYNLLHRPDYTYGALHEVYEGASLTGQYQWDWGMIQPWANYFTGYSDIHSTKTVNFKDDLKDNKDFGSYDEIYNVGFHTVTDYYVSSASYSVAPDFQKNGIIEVYSGIPIGFLTGSDNYDSSKIIKFLVKYGMEEGDGTRNSDHKTDVTEFGIGLDTGDFDILFGVTQIGEDSFRGFGTQNGRKAGGGTAVWGDMAVVNSFDLANQRTYFVVGGYDLDSVGLQKWRFQGVAAMATDTDLSKLSFNQEMLSPEKDYTEINLELLHNYGGEGLSYRFMVGADTNLDLTGFGIFLEYNTDILK
ncbi:MULTISPECIES: hypothetical protein [unclassified Endozoicomonas]|uniref:hypothetical protein n=2 Tax=Endozoicomonas TaxID=305899 RepID=UPI003BB6F9C7